jgi:hypothetical protein
MALIRFAAKVLLVMFALPALGLIAFHGGIWTGLGAALLIGIVGVFATVVLLPAIFVGLFAMLGASVVAGSFGARLVGFGIETGIYAITLGIVAWMLSGVALVGFWPTIGAAAILAIVSNILTVHKSA